MLDDLDFVAFTVAFAPIDEVQRTVEVQLAKWWKGGVQCIESPSALPLHMDKTTNPEAKEVALFEIQNRDGAVLIDTNLNDGYHSLSSMVSKALPERIFVAVRSRPVDRAEYPIEDFGIFKAGTNSYLRHVWVARDENGRWQFDQSGTVQAYERGADYTRTPLKSRLTRAHIVRYLAAMDVPIEEASRGQRVRHAITFREVVR